MRRNTNAVIAAAMAVGLIASACNSSTSDTQTTDTISAASTSAAAATTTSQATTPAPPSDNTQLPSLIPAPANNQQAKGPNNIADNGIHMFFQVNGAPNEVMNAYKAALEGKGWSVTAIVTSSGGSTYTGTNGDAYGVFDGGGYNTNTYIDVCAWPSKPANPNCERGDR